MSNTEAITVLIVDDNKNNLFTFRTLIKEYFNVHIIEAESGAAALILLLEKKVDLIILDVQMPAMDGFETAQIIRSRKKTQHIPIVFLTAAYKSEEFQKKGFAIGATDYLTKPIDTSQLISKIQLYIRFIEQDCLHKQELEHRVQERTEELLKSNNLLKKEIIERHQVEQALKKANKAAEIAKDTAEKANFFKSQFLANMSHELRTPLNAIIGYSEMLKEEAEDLEQTDFVPDLQKIHAAGKHLLGLINDVLDLSKIEAGKMELFVEPVDLDILLSDVTGTVQPLVEKKANTLEIESSDILGEIQTDMTKLRQVLLNLISNAAKFTEQGIIRLKIERQNQKDGEQVTFSVTDNGIGMTTAQQKKLFKPFIQADAATTRRFGGTGLGLTITKQFILMMGGTIQVESKFGQGSTFTICLPTNLPATTSTQPKKSTLTSKKTVLIISNESIMLESLEKDLSQLGYAVVIAENDEKALQLANKLHPNAILIDLYMSDMEGWRILSMLKDNSFLARIPVIMISAGRQKESGHAMKPSEYMIKPVKRDQLLAVLKKYHRSREDSQNLVMLIDDDKVQGAFITAVLESEGWQVFQAENGQEALDNLDDKKPVLILLDLLMPVMDGFEFLVHLQENEKWRFIPVVVLTAKELSAEEHAGLNTYVKNIMNKSTCCQKELVLQIHQLISDSSE